MPTWIYRGLIYHGLLLVLLVVLAAPRAGVLAAEAYRPFALFSTTVDIDFEDGEVDMLATFTLSNGSNGIAPATDRVQLVVSGGGRSYSATLPPGSFKSDKQGRFAYVGTVDRVKIVGLIRTLGPNRYEFEFETEGADLNGIVNPITVTLVIGGHGGSKTVRAKIE